MPNISAGSSEVAKSGFTTNQYTKRKGAGKTVTPNTIVDEIYLLAWYDFGDTSTLWKDAAGTNPVTAHDDRVARIDNKAFTLGETANQPDKFGQFARTFDANGVGGPLYKINSFNCNGNGSVRWSSGADKGLISSAAPGFGGMSPGIWTRQTTNTGAITSFYVIYPNVGPTVEGVTVDQRVCAVANNSSGATYYEDEFNVGYDSGFPGDDDILIDIKHSNGASNTMLKSSSVNMQLSSVPQIWTVEQGAEDVAGSPNDKYRIYKSGNRTIGTDGTTSKLQTQNHGGGWMEFGADCTDNVCTSETADTQLNGCIFEVIIYNKILSKAELEDVHNYLLAKYQCGTTSMPTMNTYPYNTAAGHNLWGNMLGWYDFTDPSTVKADVAGTTPISNEDGVGRIYNKARGTHSVFQPDYTMKYGNFLRARNDANRPRWKSGDVDANGHAYVHTRFNSGGFFSDECPLFGGYPTGGASAADWGGISATQFNSGSFIGNRFTMYIVCRPMSLVQTTDQYLFHATGFGVCGGSSNELYIKKSATDQYIKAGLVDNSCGVTGLSLDQGATTGSQVQVIQIELVLGSNNSKLYVQNTLRDSGTTNGVSTVGLSSTTAGVSMMCLGGKISATDPASAMNVQPFNGRIFEVMIYEHHNSIALHKNQKNHIIQYFNWKYKCGIPNCDPYINFTAIP